MAEKNLRKIAQEQVDEIKEEITLERIRSNLVELEHNKARVEKTEKIIQKLMDGEVDVSSEVERHLEVQRRERREKAL